METVVPVTREGREVVAAVRRLFTRPGYEPPMLPAVALELHELARKTNVNYQDIEQLLHSDPLLAARVIRLASSAVYGTKVRIGTMRDAMVRLGLRTLSNLFLEASMKALIFRAPGFEAQVEALRKHSIATAHAARTIRALSHANETGAFIAGLLHDIGFMIALVAVADRRIFPTTPPIEEAKQWADEAHEAAGAFIADAWKLPAEVVSVIAAHHGSPGTGLGRIVQLADAIVDGHDEDSPLVMVAADELGLSTDLLPDIRASYSALR